MKQKSAGATRETLFAYVKSKYGTSPEYLWERFPQYAVLRNDKNGKWYGVVMNVPREKLGLSGTGTTDMIGLRCTMATREMLCDLAGTVPAYHLPRVNWVGILLDGTVSAARAAALLAESYELSCGGRPARTEPMAWLLPANPKYYDIEAALARTDTTLWKQSGAFIKGDIVYLYVGAPVSAVRYRCRVVETDIPYEYADKNVRMKKAMRLRVTARYAADAFPLARLREHGVYGVRGARSVPYGLLFELEHER